MIGKTISHYKIVDKLGEGGMGSVYKAEDTTLRRLVALKALSSHLAEDAEARERFVREAQAASGLNHNNITTVYELLEDEGDQFIVMEYVEGKTIREIVESGHVSIRKALDIIIQSAEALEAAHNKGIMHRDVKSANIMVSMEGNVKVMDFGLAHLEERSQLTRTGTTMGTLAYSSPEQLTGRPVDRRSEVFSLGVVFYELLTGRLPFKSSSEGELLFEIINNEQDLPSELRKDIPANVDAIVNKMLIKKPDLRYQSCGELIGDLNAIKSELETTTVEISASLDATRAKKKKRLTLGTAVIVVVVGVISVLLTGKGGPELDPNRVVVAVFENRTGDPTKDEIGGWAADWITQSLQGLTNVNIVPSTDAMYSWQFIQADIESGKLLKNPAQVLAEQTGARIYISGSIYKDGENIRFLTNVTDASSNASIGTLEPIIGAFNSPGDAVERLPEEIIGLLALEFDERLVGEAGRITSPPSIEAYQEFQEGVEHYIRHQHEDAIPHLYKAYAIDSTFYRALIYANLCLGNIQRFAEHDSITTVLIGLGSQLTEYERCFVDYMSEIMSSARAPGFRDRTYESFRRAAEIAPGSKAVYNLAIEAVRSNRPYAAIEAIKSLDPERGPMRGWVGYWGVLAWSHHLLGDFRAELEVARTSRSLYPDESGLIYREVEALAALGQIDELNNLLDECVTLSFPDWTPAARMNQAARMLKIHGHSRNAWEEIYERAIQWYENEPGRTTSSRRGIAVAYYGLERWEEVRSLLQELETEFPENMTYKGYLGLLAARRKDMEEVQRIDSWLERGDVRAIPNQLWWRARIATVLGNHNRAILLLREALALGLDTEFPHTTIDFMPLKDNPQYRNLIDPKG